MNLFGITIDARNLFNNRILLADAAGNIQGGGWTDISMPVTLQLAPGAYRFAVQEAMSEFSFTVTAAGTLALEPETTGFMQAINGNILRLTGCPVKIDARYLTGSGIAFPTAHAPSERDDFADGFLKYERVNLLPGLPYYITTASGMVSNFFVKLNMQNGWEVLNPQTMQPDPVYNGFIRCINGAYEPELIIYGYPVLIDGRSARCPLRLADLQGAAARGNNHGNFDDAGVLFANLIPQRRVTEGFAENDLYRFETETRNYSEPGFYLTNDGQIGFDELYSLYFSVDRFNGLARLNVLYPLPDRIE